MKAILGHYALTQKLTQPPQQETEWRVLFIGNRKVRVRITMYYTNLG